MGQPYNCIRNTRVRQILLSLPLPNLQISTHIMSLHIMFSEEECYEERN